jgi:hypothetical protein
VVLTVTLVDLSVVTGPVEVAMGSSPHWWGSQLGPVVFGDSWSGLFAECAIVGLMDFD